MSVILASNRNNIRKHLYLLNNWYNLPQEPFRTKRLAASPAQSSLKTIFPPGTHRHIECASKQNHPVEMIRRDPADIRSVANSCRICSITFPTQSRYSLPTWLGGCDQAYQAEGDGARRSLPGWEGAAIKSEKDVFRSEIVCRLSTSSLTSQRGREGSEEGSGGWQVGAISRRTPARDSNIYNPDLRWLSPYTSGARDQGSTSECTDINMRDIQVFIPLRERRGQTTWITGSNNVDMTPSLCLWRCSFCLFTWGRISSFTWLPSRTHLSLLRKNTFHNV